MTSFKAIDCAVLIDVLSPAKARLYSEIDMDELRSYEQTKTISLDVQDQQDQFDGKTSDRNDVDTTWLKDKSPQVRSERDVYLKGLLTYQGT